MVKAGVCCTFGVGSSMILKMNLETAFSDLGIDAQIEVSDITNVKSAGFQVVFTSVALAGQVKEMNDEITVIGINDYFDANELKEAVKKGMKGVKS